jgi:hypothetical protein
VGEAVHGIEEAPDRLYLLMVAIALYILVSAVTDPGDWFSDGSLTTAPDR